MQLAKFGFIHRLLNRQYSRYTKIVLAVCIWPLIAVTSRSLYLANRSLTRLVIAQNLKLEIRRVVWVVNNTRLPFPSFHDYMLDFTQELDVEELKIIENLIRRKSERDVTTPSQLDLLRVLAACATDDYTKNEVSQHQILNEYFSLGCELLENISNRVNVREKTAQAQPTNKNRQSLNVSAAHQAIKDFHELFPIEKFKWFPISGTFLGIFREGRFLPYDLDIDLGFFRCANEEQRFLEKISSSNVFFLSKIEREENTNAHLSYVRLTHKNGLSLDLFWHYEIEGHIVHGTGSYLWENSKFTLKENIFHGMSILCPSPADEYLSESYGDWRTPNLDYVFHRDMPSLTATRDHKGAEYLLRRWYYFNRISNDELFFLKNFFSYS